MNTRNCTHTIIPTKTTTPLYCPDWIKRVVSLLKEWSARSRQRRDLEALNDEALLDIGLTRLDVQREISKPFWLP